MNGRELITASMRELERVKVIEAVVEGRLRCFQAAERLELSERQISRLCRRYEAAGPAGLVSAKRGRPSNRELSVDLRARAIALIRERYADFGPTLACEKLWECHGIRLGKETVRRWMYDAGLWIPRRQRPPKVYQPRARRACLGELIQIDGSEHRWFEERAPQCTLLVYVDDATSRLMMLHFTATESTFSYFEFAKPPRSDFDAHRPLRDDEDLDQLLTWRETRRVSKSLTVLYDRVLYLLDDTPANRTLIHRYIDVWEYPDGRIEIRADGAVLSCRQYDKLAEVDQGAVVEHKRLSHALQVAEAIQAQRDNRRASGSPSRANQGIAVRKPERRAGTKKPREFTQADLDGVIVELAQHRQTTKPPRKPGRRSAKDRGSDVSALPVQTPSFDTA
ncbi:ISNCY family transposase [Burkholderia ubonensis]|uniref:Integrase n=1 Tax=Burkholderia ubonensis subsp. mesacidophila TaxID=265293 RepID=A0A2A4FD47_9BURK|nr:ISNCY family transposase [Burkholderia ubonensis]PCE30590.1 integrase [Burkholderia ubonensis subsp. mesacidophila]